MQGKDPVYIAGAFEHPTREAPEKSTMQLHAEVARGALGDAGIQKDEVDALFSAGVPERGGGRSALILADYLGLDVSFADTTEYGGSSYIAHVGHAVSAIRDGRCDIALVTLAGRPRSRPKSGQDGDETYNSYQEHFEQTYGASTLTMYAMAARRHMHEYGTTSEQLAEIREAAAHHAQFNENAMYQDPVTIEDVVNSRMVATPLHLLDCCVISDGGGAIVVVSNKVRSRLDRECVEVLGYGEALKHHNGGRIDITTSGAAESGNRAYEEANLGPEQIDYASIYDSFTITVLITLEDLGFCEKGTGGQFVQGGTLKAPGGELPFNTDGGGLCSNHPGNRGGMTKIIEAVRQLRGEAHPEVQVGAEIALAHGTGGILPLRHAATTVILGSEDG